jgi:hypothetical protein
MKRHLVFAISGMLASSATACADAPGKAEGPKSVKAAYFPSDVFLSSPPCTFVASFQALVLQPSGSNLYYAAEAHPLPLVTPDWKIHEVHPGYHFGFDVAIGRAFHSTNSSLTLDWEHFDSGDSDRRKVSSQNMVGPFFEIGPDASSYKKTEGHASFRFNQVNLNYGVFVHFGDRLRTDFFAGVSFARIRQIMRAKYSNLAGDIKRTIKIPSTFLGAGPQLGFNFSYCIVKGFQFIGEGIGTFFVGRLKNHTQYTTASPALIPLGIAVNKQRTGVSERAQVVPGLEGKLGLSYSYLFCKHYVIKIEAGYEAQIYLNAIQSTDMSSQVDLTPGIQAIEGVYARTFRRTLSNFAMAGPYAAIDFAF